MLALPHRPFSLGLCVSPCLSLVRTPVTGFRAPLPGVISPREPSLNDTCKDHYSQSGPIQGLQVGPIFWWGGAPFSPRSPEGFKESCHPGSPPVNDIGTLGVGRHSPGEFSKLLVAKPKGAFVFPVAFYVTGKSTLKQVQAGGSTWWRVQGNFYPRWVPARVGRCACVTSL